MDNTPSQKRYTLSITAEESGDWLRLLDESVSAPPVAAWPLSHPPQPSTAALSSHSTPTPSHTSTEEIKAPTRPVTPNRLSAEDLYWASAIDHDPLISRSLLTSSPGSESNTRVLAPQVNRVIAAGTPNCAVCYENFEGWPAEYRADHSNTCWDGMRAAAIQNIGSRRRMVPSRMPLNTQPAAALSPTNTALLLPPCILCDMTLMRLSPIDAFDHRTRCQRGLNYVLDACPCCDTSFNAASTPWNNTQIAEHLYTCSIPDSADTFETLQDAWLARRNAHKNPANCALCTKDLRDLDDVDAFHHRRRCVMERRPIECPVCLNCIRRIEPGGRWTVETVLWHLHTCQNDNTLSAIARDDFETLDVRLRGRMQGLWRMFSKNDDPEIGPRKHWGWREHQHSYRSKTRAGRDNEAGLYLIGASKLRTIGTYNPDGVGGVRVATKVKSTGPVWASIAWFGRTQYAVYQVPLANLRMIGGVRSEYVVYDTVYDWPDNRAELRTIRSDSTPTTPEEVVDESPVLAAIAVEDCPPSPWNTATPLSPTIGGEERRRRAVDKAEMTGTRVPPGFESPSRGTTQELPPETVPKSNASREYEQQSLVLLPREVTSISGLRFTCEDEEGEEDSGL